MITSGSVVKALGVLRGDPSLMQKVKMWIIALKLTQDCH